MEVMSKEVRQAVARNLPWLVQLAEIATEEGFHENTELWRNRAQWILHRAAGDATLPEKKAAVDYVLFG